MKLLFQKTFALSFIAVIALSFAFGFAYHAQAAVDTNAYTPLAPIPGVNDTNNGQTDVSTFIPAAIKLTIQIAGALAVVMIVIGGVQYASSDAISGKSEGKSKITNAIYGLLLAIAAFVILQTVNPNTLKLNLDLSIPTPAGTTISSSNPNGTGCPLNTTKSSTDGTCVPNVNSTGNTTWPLWSGSVPTPTDASVRSKLASLPVPITVADGDCASVGATGCTSLDGLSSGASGGLASLSDRARGTGASIQINGGTEYWLHCVPKSITAAQCADPAVNGTMHRPGGGAIDLQTNTALNTLIQKGTPGSATNNGCENSSLGVFLLDNGIYVKEDSGHWHVCYQ